MTRCPLCPGVNPCVPPDGPKQCELLFIGESPGRDETRKLRPFVGRTGEEVNRHYLPLAGLRRDSVRFTNAVKCQPSTPDGKLHMDKQADKALLESCANFHLYNEIQETQPSVIITLGAFSAFAIDPSTNLELHHGIPRESPFGTLYSMYHPALGLYEPKKMLQIRTDWDRLRRYLRGVLNRPVDEFADCVDYQHLSRLEHIRESLGGQWDRPLAVDTEITKDHDPYCLSYSCQPGTGYVIRADDPDAILTFQQELDRWMGKILVHNWLFDSDVLDLMQVRINTRLLVDTMERCYHLGNIPQGLKALAYRELGVQMQDFDDLVRPYSVPKALAYYRQAMMEKWPKPPSYLEMDFKAGEMKEKKPQSMTTKLKRFLNEFGKDPDKDPFEAWKKWEKDNAGSQAMIESVYGQFPGLCISHVPWPEAIHYSARDADVLGRLWPVIDHMSRQVRKKPQERWKD